MAAYWTRSVRTASVAVLLALLSPWTGSLFGSRFDSRSGAALADTVGSLPLAGSSISVRDDGQLLNGPASETFRMFGGLWLGAIVPSPTRADTLVSTAWPPEFAPVAPDRDTDLPLAERLAAEFTDDVPATDHQALGAFVHERAVPVQIPHGGPAIDVTWEITNESGGAWTEVFVGLQLDPDLGRASSGTAYWGDDTVRFEAWGSTSLARRGDTVCLEDSDVIPEDSPGLSLGIGAVQNAFHRVHLTLDSIDPPDDTARWRLMRGDFADRPTIDPAPGFPDDVRLLVVFPPVDVWPAGGTRSFRMTISVQFDAGDPAAPGAPDAIAELAPAVAPPFRVWPNPAPAGANAVELSVGGAEIAVFDLAGRRIRTLPAGAARWDLRTDLGRPVAAGIYFLRPDGGARSATRLIVLGR
ncbi:MAG: T9SS type A sorting domain-containing protein [bacterium]